MAIPYDPTNSLSGTVPFEEYLAQQGFPAAADLSPEELSSWYRQWQMTQEGPDPNRAQTPVVTPTPESSPYVAPVSDGGGGEGGGGNPYTSSGFVFPDFQARRYSSPAPFSGPAQAFDFQSFAAPTMADAEGEPGYALANKEGLKALETSAAHAGTLRSGGAQKGLASWANQFAEQNYGNVFNRASNVWNMNRNNAAENYLTNYGISRDVWSLNADEGRQNYDRNFNAEAAEFNPQFQASQLKFADLFNRQQLNTNALTTLAGYGAV